MTQPPGTARPGKRSPPGIYPATKSFILVYSQSLQAELGPRGLYVQAVLPSSTRTEMWERSKVPPGTVTVMMDVEEMVDAALAGFDQREAVTIPSLPDVGQFNMLEAARVAMTPNLRQRHCAARYRASAASSVDSERAAT